MAKVMIEHVHIETAKPFDDVRASFEAQVGKFDWVVYDHLRNGRDPQDVRAVLEKMVGSSGFMLFGINDHGGLLRMVGQTRNAVQYIIGNPLFAIQMTQHDIRAGLYAPLRVLIYENEKGKTCIEYDLAASQFGQFGNASVLEVAIMLDRKMEQLVADVLQDEVTKEESKSGLPMFGNSFAKLAGQTVSATVASPLTVEQARKIVMPLYEALNEPAKKDVNALLAKAAHPDYRSYHTNEEWLTRDQLVDIFKGMGVTIPNLRWEIKDIQVIDDQVIVRGEATGTPKDEFWGTKPTGKSFKTMAIDIFTVKNGKLASCYHVENWMTALQQIEE